MHKMQQTFGPVTLSRRQASCFVGRNEAVIHVNLVSHLGTAVGHIRECRRLAQQERPWELLPNQALLCTVLLTVLAWG